ncbi:MAG: hypothetical protein L0Z62_36445 [Gemmataceae bacterium]|nr:hypothetical protein [Gemmataceae bacterium]
MRVRVLARHIRAGVAGNCFRCAIALGLQEATGDNEAHVYERDWNMYLEVHSRHIVAPVEVRIFVWTVDSLDRREDGRPKLPRRLAGTDFAPFAFDLPAWDSPEWQEECYVCEGLCAPADLDDEGCCEECRDSEMEE